MNATQRVGNQYLLCAYSDCAPWPRFRGSCRSESNATGVICTNLHFLSDFGPLTSFCMLPQFCWTQSWQNFLLLICSDRRGGCSPGKAGAVISEGVSESNERLHHPFCWPQRHSMQHLQESPGCQAASSRLLGPEAASQQAYPGGCPCFQPWRQGRFLGVIGLPNGHF